MSKYDKLWEHIKDNDDQEIKLTFEEINEIIGFEIDHSFLDYKKELIQYGYKVGKISLKDKTVVFSKTE